VRTRTPFFLLPSFLPLFPDRGAANADAFFSFKLRAQIGSPPGCSASVVYFFFLRPPSLADLCFCAAFLFRSPCHGLNGPCSRDFFASFSLHRLPRFATPYYQSPKFFFPPTAPIRSFLFLMVARLFLPGTPLFKNGNSIFSLLQPHPNGF